jgi:hypothetical protein
LIGLNKKALETCDECEVLHLHRYLLHELVVGAHKLEFNELFLYFILEEAVDRVAFEQKLVSSDDELRDPDPERIEGDFLGNVRESGHGGFPGTTLGRKVKVLDGEQRAVKLLTKEENGIEIYEPVLDKRRLHLTNIRMSAVLATVNVIVRQFRDIEKVNVRRGEDGLAVLAGQHDYLRE